MGIRPSCPPSLTYALFSNRDLKISSSTVINADTQVNRHMVVSHGNNVFLGETDVVETWRDRQFTNNTYKRLNTVAANIPYKKFSSDCLVKSADHVIDGNVKINNEEDAEIFQEKLVWVNGKVSVSGSNISIHGNGLLARNGIEITGENFSYYSSGCFALYSHLGEIKITNGPYNISGLVYTASEKKGDIKITTSQGGSICGAIIAARDVIFTGGSAVHKITNSDECSICQKCIDLCSEI